MNDDTLWRLHFIEGLRGAQPAPMLTAAADAARGAPLVPSRAHNERFKDENSAVISCPISGLGVVPNAVGTKGRRAQKHSYGPLKPRGSPFGLAAISTVALRHP
jgi:hypothetical protein